MYQSVSNLEESHKNTNKSANRWIRLQNDVPSQTSVPHRSQPRFDRRFSHIRPRTTRHAEREKERELQ